MAHIGRSSNQELRQKKIKKIVKVVLIVFLIIILMGGILIFLNNKLGIIDNFSTKKLAISSTVNGYYCPDSTYKLTKNKCVKTLKESPALLGDVDLDGKITTKDTKLLESYIDDDKQSKFSALQFAAANIDKNGEINYIDLNILSFYFDDNAKVGTYELYYDKIGIEKVCPKGYKLKNKMCEKTITKNASVRNVIEIDIEDDQKNATNLKANTTVNLMTTFKMNDNSKIYYYIWRTYNNGKLHHTSDCKKIATSNQDKVKKATSLKVVGTRKGTFTVYSDSSCKSKLKEVSTKEYKCSNCKVSVSITPNDKNDTKVLNSVQNKKFTIKLDNPSSTKYYYIWKDSTKKNGSSCSVLKNNMTTSLNINSKKYGTLTVYSDGKCKKKVISKNTSTYSLSNIIWPVTPKFKLLYHDKKVYREKHYVYGSKSEWHEGLDITTPIGTPVYAIADGTVRYTNTYSGSYKDEDYGNVIFIKTKINGKYYSVAYAHLKNSPTQYVKLGQSVKKGQLIGYSGISGGSRIPHLHIDFHPLINNKVTYTNLLDPLKVLPKVDYSKLKSNIKNNDYSKEQFPTSSVNLFNRMMSAQNNNKANSYKIEAVAKVKIGAIPKGATVELIRRTKSPNSLVTIKYKGKTYTNLSAGNFKFVW